MSHDPRPAPRPDAETALLRGFAVAWLTGFGALALASPPDDLVTAGVVVLSMPTAVIFTLWGRARRWWGA